MVHMFGSCFSGDGGPQTDVKTNMSEGVESFIVMKKMRRLWSINLGVKI